MPKRSQKSVREREKHSDQSGEIVRHIQTAQIWNGPLPSPKDLAAFGEVDPQIPVLIAKMAVEEQQHQHKMDELIVSAESKKIVRGQRYSLVISLALIALTLAGIWFKETKIGVVLATSLVLYSIAGVSGAIGSLIEIFRDKGKKKDH